MTRPTRMLLVPLTLLGLAASACGSDEGGGSADTAAATTGAVAPPTAATTAAPTTSEPAVQGDITVFAAASLTDAFTDIGEAFTQANPDAKVTYSFDASSALVTQITEGAPADLFASADVANMDKLTGAGLNGSEPVIFATNLLSIIVPDGNPAGVTGVADLAKPEVKTVLCAPEVPCGRYSAQILQAAGVTVTPVSLEQNVKGVATKVAGDEADAGIVYVTDVLAAGDAAEGVEIPADINVVAEYPIASVATSTKAEVNQAFIDFLLGEQGQAILADYGFLPP